MRSWHQDDLLELVERILADTEDAGEKTVVLNTKAARALLELAKCAPKPRGRPPVKGRDRVNENVALRSARNKEKKLIAEGMPKGAARRKVSEETAVKLRKRNLDASTIKRRLEKR
ncbi:hypothetical protein [Sinorhizobium fredii]|uniref:hypothetical protein n=1 Tax=Rhizobium fredii TaxID=380 RepID=UPI001319D74E|nr:hypothetical protein [Sinorhizobium fredii]